MLPSSFVVQASLCEQLMETAERERAWERDARAAPANLSVGSAEPEAQQWGQSDPNPVGS